MPALAWSQTAALPQFGPRHHDAHLEIERGMTGYGLTVFQGVEITLRRRDPGSDRANLARTSSVNCHSGPVVERRSGIIGGMSGSPVYVNDRPMARSRTGLLHEAIGGVTPIEAMLTPYAGGQARLPGDHPARGAMLRR